MSFHCPTCGVDVATRVLADPVTLVVVGHCADHGVLELSRVYIGEPAAPAYPEGQDEAGRPVAYKPGQECGRRLGESTSCRLPIGHGEDHLA